MKHREIRRRWPASRLFIGFLALLGLMLMLAGPAQARKYSGATNSSPITLSADGKYLWTVNPGADNVSVIYTKTNKVIAKIKVGDEPQSVAVDPNNRYAYVANAASGSVTVIRITKAKGAKLKAKADRRAGSKGQIVTGAEPWNVVVSPNGRRVYVANSGQDTITVIDGTKPRRKRGVIGHVNLKLSRCNDPDRTRHFQPRGLAVSKNNKRLLVTSFFSWTIPGGVQGNDAGRAGVVCRIGLSSKSKKIRTYRVQSKVSLAPQVTGFTVDSTGDGVPDPTSAFPNQLQSVVIHGNQAYLPNIAASPSGPLKFNVDTQAFVSVLNGAGSGTTADAGATKFINLHLGARQPEPAKKKLFFANAWAIGFTKRGAGAAYVVSAGSDLLVKVNVDGSGKLTNTVDADTTRYIDLNDPANPATAGNNAGKNPQGIVVNKQGTRAYVQNFVSRNVSVVDLTQDKVLSTIRTAPLPAPGSPEEVALVGAEVFFSSRGLFNKAPGQTTANQERLSSDGWQSCSSCHFKGLTDSIIWTFNTGPRKSVPLNATFNPNNHADQRVLNYSAIFDEVEDFEANIRNVSGPGALAAALPCTTPPPATNTLDPNHGLLIGDDTNGNVAPCVLNSFAKPNAGRAQHTVTLPGSTTQVPALTALREWVKLAVRTPHGPSKARGLVNRLTSKEVSQGRTLFTQAGCSACHVGGKWTVSTKDFASPPAGTEIFTETAPAATFGAPIGAQYLNRFLRNIGSFNLGVKGGPNPLGANVGAVEKATQALNAAGVAGPAPDALGIDYNADGRGNGFNVPSLLGIDASPPYYHNGACESLDCVVGNVKHRTVNGTRADGLPNSKDRALVVKFLKSIDARTKP